jgi:hypothetical protein
VHLASHRCSGDGSSLSRQQQWQPPTVFVLQEGTTSLRFSLYRAATATADELAR